MRYSRLATPERRLPDGVVIVSAMGHALALASTSAFIWDLLLCPSTGLELVDQVATAWPGVSHDEIEATVAEVVRVLIEAGVVVEGEDSDSS